MNTAGFLAALAAATAISAAAQNPPVTPAWAFRHIVWEDSINTSAGARDIVKGYLDRDIPVGAVIIDSPWSLAYNDFNWDPERYPDPEQMIAWFRDRDIKVYLWLTGAVNTKSKDTPRDKAANYDEAVAGNYGINGSRPGEWWKGEGVHIDFTNPEACKWWATQLDKVFVDGVYGWKVDQGEFWFGDSIDTSLGRMSNAGFRPYYYDAMYDYTVSRNPAGVILARPYSHQGGCAASVGKLNMGWCGDFSGTWSGLKEQIDNIYTSARHGYGAVSCEVGGFFGDRASKEELIRYAQFGSMTAAMINGGENGAFTNHLPWWHDAQTADIYRDCVLLHEQLVPYLFSASVDCHLHGGSIFKDVNFDEESHRLSESIFTKAITAPGGEASFRLPDGGEWVDYWSGRSYQGGTVISEVYPLDRFPLFVRKGAVIPVAADHPTFHVYPGADADVTLHLPSGEGVDYADYKVNLDSSNGKLTVDCPSKQTVTVVVKDGSGRTLTADGRSIRFDINEEVLSL